MKKNYLRPEAQLLAFTQSTEILRPKPTSDTGDGEILGKDRDDDYSEGGDSPIWGEGGKLW